MVWIIVIAIILVLLSTGAGKVALVAGVGALAFLLIQWLTDLEIFGSFAKVAGVAVVVIIAGLIIKFIFDD